jgi:hypothetical protein
MKKVKALILIIFESVLDISVFGYGVLKQLILPNRTRKGNIVSTVFLLFIGLTERVISFKRKVTGAPWQYGKRYIRIGMLIATWLLFVLSLFEWSGTSFSASKIPSLHSTALSDSPKTISNSPEVISDSAKTGRKVFISAPDQRSRYADKIQASAATLIATGARGIASIPSKRYLLLRSLRI